ncbi:MAG TPA: hypothetical protein VED59_08790, partial [Acidimicrobiales bacterium]|nr:hypothetical protein [Acidimicrobiales bacterium]
VKATTLSVRRRRRGRPSAGARAKRRIRLAVPDIAWLRGVHVAVDVSPATQAAGLIDELTGRRHHDVVVEITEHTPSRTTWSLGHPARMPPGHRAAERRRGALRDRSVSAP